MTQTSSDVSSRALDESLNLVRKALELEPADSEMHLLLGKILDRKGAFTEAVEAFSAAVRLQTE